MTSEEERAKGWAMGEGVRERVALDLVRYIPERLASREIRGVLGFFLYFFFSNFLQKKMQNARKDGRKSFVRRLSRLSGERPPRLSVVVRFLHMARIK